MNTKKTSIVEYINLRDFKHLSLTDAKDVKLLMKRLLNKNTDKRRISYTKSKQAEWMQFVYLLVCNLKLTIPKHSKSTYRLMAREVIGQQKYVRLPSLQKLMFLRLVDNAFIILLADLNLYLDSSGKKYKIRELHPKHREAAIKKMIDMSYTLPLQFYDRRDRIKVGGQ